MIRAAPFGAGVACLIAVFALAAELDRFAPLRNWFFWRLAAIWGWELLFVSGCFSLGALVCRWALRGAPEVPALERAVLALAAGTTAFALLLYLGGAARILRPYFAVAMPIGSMVAATIWARPQVTATMRALRRGRWPVSGGQVALLAFGIISVALVYLHILNPDALNHDAHWTHVVIAQDYAREGRIVPVYASWARNFPHLASVIYTWCYLVPGLADQERLLLIMHTEFVLFLGTLVAVVAATNWLTDGVSGSRLAWVAFFLFPSIFIYDSNLGGAADHVAAFFILPLFLAFMRAGERMSVGLCALAGGFAGAVLITKYQSAYATAALGLVMTGHFGRVVLRKYWRRDDNAGGAGAAAGALSSRQVLRGLAVLAAAGLVTSSPYFLENIIFYSNPFYPFMQSVFRGSRPTLPEAAWIVSNVATPASVRGAPELSLRLWNGLGTLFTFAFRPHYAFTNGVPYFGFLFTLLAPLSLLIPGARRLRIGALVGGLTVLAWAMTYLVDRNLQIVLPILVAVTAGVIARLWDLGWVARVGLIPLVGFQVVWGADFMFEGTLQGYIANVRSGAAGLVNVRETIHRRAMTRVLPRDAVVIVHSDHPTLGLDRPVLADLSESQGLIDYHQLRSAREAYDRFRSLGVTHATWLEVNSMFNPIRQAEIVFAAVTKALPTQAFGPYRLVELPHVPPPPTGPYRVLTWGVPGSADGVYPIEELSKCEMRPPEMCTGAPIAVTRIDAGTLPSALQSVDVVLLPPGGRLDAAADAALRSRFVLAKPTPQFDIYLVR